jgi:hypothetical protein
MSYAFYSQARWVVADIALIAAIITIAYFAKSPRRMSGSTALVTVVWALAPPIWFFSEYYAVDHDCLTNLPAEKHELLDSVKTYADYASKIWAAVLGAILFLVRKD